MSKNKTNLTCPKCQSTDIHLYEHKYYCRSCGCEWQLAEDVPVQEKSLTTRNSTAEFLIFQAQSQANGVEIFYRNETLCLTQKAMAALFDVDRTVVTKHLKNIFEEGELQADTVCANFAHTAADGKIYQ